MWIQENHRCRSQALQGEALVLGPGSGPAARRRSCVMYNRSCALLLGWLARVVGSRPERPARGSFWLRSPTSRTGPPPLTRFFSICVLPVLSQNQSGVSSKFTHTAPGDVDCTHLQNCQKRSTRSDTTASDKVNKCATARTATPHRPRQRRTHCEDSLADVLGMSSAPTPSAAKSRTARRA